MRSSTRAFALPVLSALALTACGTTRRYVDQPSLSVDDPAGSARQAAAGLFGPPSPYTVQLCEADQASRQCNQDNVGITAYGVGGLFIPLTLHVTGMTVTQLKPVTDGWDIDAAFHSKADAIAPLCHSAHGQILSRDNNTMALQLRHFYCNWAVVGNVIVNVDLSVDNVSLKDRAFTGFYRITFHGTGNAAGSGYYRGVIVPST